MNLPESNCKGCTARDRLNQTFAVRIDELEQFVSRIRTRSTSPRKVSQFPGSPETARETFTKRSESNDQSRKN